MSDDLALRHYSPDTIAAAPDDFTHTHPRYPIFPHLE